MTALSSAADFIRRTARPLERHAYACLFEEAPADDFLLVLGAYQRDDGGFGGGLEPDCLALDSHPLFVDFALKSLYQVGARATALGQPTCGFLRSVSEADGALPYLLPSALEHPRAAHWHELRPTSLELTYGIVGLLHWLGVRDEWLDAATASCQRALVDPPDEAHALIGVLDFLEHAPAWPGRDAALARVLEILPTARWLAVELPFEGYALTPLHLAPRPDAPARSRFDDATIAAHLDALAAEQQDDGGWPLAWEPPSDAARDAWRGKWTLDAIAVLRAYGRL